MERPLALDMFCGAGGVAEGLYRAGYQPIGVDINPQKNYPFPFIQADVMNLSFARFALAWASPPCQGYSDMQHAPGAKEHPLLIEPIRNKLIRSKVPYVIENVMGAPLVNPIVLCGCQFGLGVEGFRLERKRQFECSFAVDQPKCKDHSLPVIGMYGGHVRCRSSKFWRGTGADFPNQDKPALAKQAMGIDWMTMNEMSQAIPPAFAQYIGTAARIAAIPQLREAAE
jgi:DNA (cytosine-5)-methyltransferase 1